MIKMPKYEEMFKKPTGNPNYDPKSDEARERSGVENVTWEQLHDVAEWATGAKGKRT